MDKKKIFLFVALFFAIFGLVDATYLTYEHFTVQIPPCTTNILFIDCGKVLTSKYSMIASIPVALLGAVYYFVLVWMLLSLTVSKFRRFVGKFLVIQTALGFLMSLYFVYLQLLVIKAICFYCFVSALISTIIFFSVQYSLSENRKTLVKSIFQKSRPNSQLPTSGQFSAKIN